MQSINADQLKTRQNQGERLTLINTLSEASFESTRIPGSINIPLEKSDFEKRVEQTIGGKNQPVVLYCASADCHSSTKAAKRLEESGFTEVMDFEGGAKEWEEQGGHLAHAS
ncbi:rhodanese-like domain-containing protein [Bremerella cremea]|uniref:Rhodanese-like domain-containing protein n=1 Tax=Blastopirellula marina TaxID=124 RepID=A0A2S8FE69_9BACT|nr:MULTISPECIES: rhodanese-like domain-containing protein [Pirellulaceae]PQO30455.1 rhodanese-like domain-containing protein [Blastopirellula marina]RCS43808.1 rhodanese-like domain-containing protein [Bremerella cremea]